MSIRQKEIIDPKILTEGKKKKAFRRTPVIVSLLANESLTTVDVKRLMEAGMNVARMKISHNRPKQRLHMIKMLNEAAEFCRMKQKVDYWPSAICVTLKTYITLTGMLETEERFVTMKKGSDVVLTNDISFYKKCSEQIIYTDYPRIGRYLNIGREITIHLFEIVTLECTKIIDDKTIQCKVINEGLVESMSFLTVRGFPRNMPFLSKRDYQGLDFAKEFQVDVIVVLYARSSELIKKIREYLGPDYRPVILAGICTDEGIKNVKEIIAEADGIIFSRHILIFELEPCYVNRLHLIQKKITARCLKAGKPLYLSGFILQSVLTGERKAAISEISDITNALFDGITGFVLGEYREPDHIVEALHILNDICISVEAVCTQKKDIWTIFDETVVPVNAAEAAVLGCSLAAVQTSARLIVLPTVTGNTVRTLMKMKPTVVVITVSTKQQVATNLHAYFSIIPLIYKKPLHEDHKTSLDARIRFAISYAINMGLAVYGDAYITLYKGKETSLYCDTISVETVTISKAHFVECDENDYKSYP